MKKCELVNEAIEMLKNDDELLINVCNELARYDGRLNELFQMYELDEMYWNCKATDLINDLTEEFNINDEYFYWDDNHDLYSTDYATDFYLAQMDYGEILDNALDIIRELQWLNDRDFVEILEALDNGDFEE